MEGKIRQRWVLIAFLSFLGVLSGDGPAVFSLEKHGPPIETAAGTLSLEEAKKEIARRMRSGAWADRAWGVYLTGQYGLSEYRWALSDLLDPVGPKPSHEQNLFYRVVLDSLIQLEAAVPAEKLLAYYKPFPDEVLILLAKRPEENRAALLSVLKEEASGMRQMAICNRLVRLKAPGLAAFLLRDLTIHLTITVYDDQAPTQGQGGGMASCIGLGAPDPEDFPPIARYELVGQASKGAQMLAPGRHPIYYARHLGRPGMSYTGRWTSYEWDGQDPDVMRTEYLADLLDTAVARLPFTPRPAYRVRWTGPEEFQREVARIRVAVEGSFEQLLEGLMAKGLLSAAEVPALRLNLSLFLDDERGDQSQALPDIEGAHYF